MSSFFGYLLLVSKEGRAHNRLTCESKCKPYRGLLAAGQLHDIRRISKGVHMPSAEYFNPVSLSKSSGYTQVVKVDNTVYIAGQVSIAADGKIVGQGDPETQVRQVWHNLEAAVRSVGGSRQDIVKTTTYVTHIDHAAAVRKVRDELFQAANPPTSTLLVISALAHPDFMVEIEAIAVLSG
jgi:enamine deaminase RidA (YjgF/YER057c/UK114 family)